MSDMKRRMACTKDTVNFVDTEASVRVSENGKMNLTEHNASKCPAVVGDFPYVPTLISLPACLPTSYQSAKTKLIPTFKINSPIKTCWYIVKIPFNCQDTFQWPSTDKKKSSSSVQAVQMLLMRRTPVSQTLLIEARSITGIETHTASVGVWETFSSVAPHQLNPSSEGCRFKVSFEFLASPANAINTHSTSKKTILRLPNEVPLHVSKLTRFIPTAICLALTCKRLCLVYLETLRHRSARVENRLWNSTNGFWKYKLIENLIREWIHK
jgi:hypothetical protein